MSALCVSGVPLLVLSLVLLLLLLTHNARALSLMICVATFPGEKGLLFRAFGWQAYWRVQPAPGPVSDFT